MIVSVPKETFPGERRVALIPASAGSLLQSGLQVKIEAGAGEAAGFPDAQYREAGAQVVESRSDVFTSVIVVQVRALGANPEAGKADLELMDRSQAIIGLCDPLAMPQQAQEVAARGATLFSLELIPRITRAQSMDVLSSMATIAG